MLILLEGKRISLGQAAEALGLTPRQVRWLRVGLRDEGPAALIHGNRGRRSLHRLPVALRAQEDAAGYLALLRTLGQTVGLPAAVNTDAHGVLVRNDAHWTLAEQLQGFHAPTQVGRALQALGIHHLVVESPQAKGRTERLWDTFRDCLAAELRLAGITTLAAGNVFLATTFLPAFNTQFAVLPAVAASAYRPAARAQRSGAGRGRTFSLSTDRLKEEEMGRGGERLLSG